MKPKVFDEDIIFDDEHTKPLNSKAFSTSRSFDSKFVNVVGLGLFTFFGKPAQIVQKAALQIVPAKQCRDSARNDSKMCTYTEGKDSCTSDR